MKDYWDNPRGQACIEAIRSQGEEIHPVQHGDGHRSLGLWFNGNWQRGCLTPDLWLPDLGSLELFANVGRQAYFRVEQRKTAYQVLVQYDDRTVKYGDNHEARLDMIRRYQKENRWPNKIVGFNPFTGEDVAEYQAHKHARYVIVLRPKGEDPLMLPE